MIEQHCTEERIINLMKKGAHLIVHKSACSDGENFTFDFGLEYNGREINLTEIPVTECPGGEDNYPARSALAERLIKRNDVKQVYGGYISDYARTWKEHYEHTSRPVPRWIREQWANPVQRYEDSRL